jgi:NAD(P)-dependent dehydrogenase (short-subunit alcohol dehydrogenase family)
MRNALITGSSSGLGRSISLRLSETGYRILVHGRRSEGIKNTCNLIEQSGGQAEGRPANLKDITAAQELARWAVSSGALQVVVHNAGGYAPAPVGEDSLEEWDEILGVQLRAAMHITAITLPSLIETQGAYVFIGSVDALVGNARRSASTAASAGRVGFAKSLFEEVREHGVRVITIHPGFMNTPLASPGRLDPARMIQTEDIAELVATAVSLPQSSCVVEMTVRPQRSPYNRTQGEVQK